MSSLPPPPLTPWRALGLRRAGTPDLAFCGAVLGLVGLALASGNAAGRRLSPEGAQSTARLLDELELPRSLPNAMLARDDGLDTRLWDVATAPRTIVTFYAPWCAPCQDELPTLVKGTSAHSDRLTVIVGPDEDPAEVRRKLENLGLKDQRFHVDTRRELEAGGRVTALPTTFLIGPMGKVHERMVGYSEVRLQMLLYKATSGDVLTPEADGN